MKILKKLGLVFIGVFGFVTATTADKATLQLGDTAPTFILPNSEGKPIGLKDYLGQWVVIYFYPKDDTPGCTTQACSFRDNINHLIANKAVILGISVNDRASHEKFKKNYKLPFDLLSDTDGQVARSYNALSDFKIIKFAKRHTYIVDPQGKIAKIYQNVDPDENVQDVINDLKKLQTI